MINNGRRPCFAIIVEESHSFLQIVRTISGTQISRTKIIVIPPSSDESRGWFIKRNAATKAAYALRHAARIATMRK
jgi:hypothetical protein